MQLAEPSFRKGPKRALVMQNLLVWRGFRACLGRPAALHNGGNSTGLTDNKA